MMNAETPIYSRTHGLYQAGQTRGKHHARYFEEPLMRAPVSKHDGALKRDFIE